MRKHDSHIVSSRIQRIIIRHSRHYQNGAKDLAPAACRRRCLHCAFGSKETTAQTHRRNLKLDRGR